MQGFDALNPPFDRLTHAETEALRGAVDIGYFAPGSVIVERGGSSEFLHVIIKGAVAEKTGDETEALLGPKDTFDSEAVVHGSASASFVAEEETLCYLLPRVLILELVQKNQAFAAFFYSELSRRLDAFRGTSQSRAALELVLRLRVKEARCQEAHFHRRRLHHRAGGPCDARAQQRHAVRPRCRPHRHRHRHEFGRRPSFCGACRLRRRFGRSAISTSPRSTPDDFLFDALIAMTRHKKRRIAIRAGGRLYRRASRISTFSSCSPAIRSSSPAASTARKPSRTSSLAQPIFRRRCSA